MGGLAVAALVVGGLWALRRMGRMSPAETRRFQRQLMGAGLGLVGLFLLFHGNLLIGAPVLVASAGILGFTHLLPQGFQPSARAASPPATGPMDRAEALSVLGLKSGATADEIKAAHKRLQRANHPDTGGSDYLSGKINQARDILLRSA